MKQLVGLSLTGPVRGGELERRSLALAVPRLE